MYPVNKDQGRTVPVVVPTPFDVGDVNMYLYEDQGSLTLIDAAIDSEEGWRLLLDALSENGWSLSDLSQIWLTHHHQDHVGLVNRIVSQVEVPVYVHSKALPRLRRDPQFLDMRIRFFDRLYREMGCGLAGERQTARLEEARRRNAGLAVQADFLPLKAGGRAGRCEVWEVPGHAPDHVAFWDPQRKWLFAGDHLIAHISSNAFVEPDENGELIPTLVQYAESLAQCLRFDVGLTFSGHGKWIEDHRGLIEKRLSRIGEKAELVLKRIQGGLSTAYELAADMYGGKIDRAFGPVMSEIIGLLGYLEHENKVQKKLQADGVWHYMPL